VSQTKQDIEKKLLMCNSYAKLEELINCIDDIPPDEWFSLLGSEWSCCDNIHSYTDELNEQFDLHSHDARRRMMNDIEMELFEALPEIVTIYRGCSAVNMLGLSWTLSKAVAEEITTLNRYAPPQNLPSMVITTAISKDLIIALKTCRDEDEVIIPSSAFFGGIA